MGLPDGGVDSRNRAAKTSLGEYHTRVSFAKDLLGTPGTEGEGSPGFGVSFGNEPVYE